MSGLGRRQVVIVALVALLLLIGTLPALAATVTRGNPASIAINDAGAASPYPSTIDVGGLSGIVSDVNVTLTGLSHEVPTDVTVLLASPTGQTVVLMDDAGGESGRGANNVTLTFDDAAVSQLPQTIDGGLFSGTYKPTPAPAVNISCNEVSAPASTPASPHGTTLSVFNGTNPNGIWSLYVYDDCSNGTGEIAGGWSLEITAPGAAVTVPDDMTVASDPGQPGAVVVFSATGVDDDGSSLAPVCTPPSWSFFPIGTTTVSCMVTGFNGREATDSFTITVIDTEPPTLTVPEDIIVVADGPGGTSVSYSASAADNSGNVTLTCYPPSGSVFQAGTTTVTCTATDGSNNTTSGSFTVTVAETSDLLAQLRADTIALVDNSVAERSMVAWLDIAQSALDRNNPWLARFALLLYESLLEGQISTGRISAADGEQLRAQLHTLIDTIR